MYSQYSDNPSPSSPPPFFYSKQVGWEENINNMIGILITNKEPLYLILIIKTNIMLRLSDLLTFKIPTIQQ